MSLSRAIAACARAHGAEIVTRAPVRKILVRDGEARGVQLADGREFHARRAVVSAVDPTQLFLRLVGEEHLDGGLVRKVRRIEYGAAVGSVHFALSGLPKYRVKEASTAAYVHTTPSFDFMTKVMSEARQGLIPQQPWYLVTNDAVFDPSRAPHGKGVMKFLVTPLPYEIKGDGARKLRAKRWDRVKEEVADRCQNDWAQYVPGVRRTILKRVVESPIDLEERISTSVRGSLAGGYAGFHQFWAFRPIPGYAAYRTPIKRLYMTGMGTHPGPGVSTIPGRNTARAVLEDLRIRFDTIAAPAPA